MVLPCGVTMPQALIAALCRRAWAEQPTCLATLLKHVGAWWRGLMFACYVCWLRKCQCWGLHTLHFTPQACAGFTHLRHGAHLRAAGASRAITEAWFVFTSSPRLCAGVRIRIYGARRRAAGAALGRAGPAAHAAGRRAGGPGPPARPRVRPGLRLAAAPGGRRRAQPCRSRLARARAGAHVPEADVCSSLHAASFFYSIVQPPGPCASRRNCLSDSRLSSQHTACVTELALSVAVEEAAPISRTLLRRPLTLLSVVLHVITILQHLLVLTFS